MVNVTDIGCDMPGALRVRTLLLYWPDCDGACTVIVSWVVPGARFPTDIELDVVGTEVDVPPFTDSVQPRMVNFEKSPDETKVALLNVVAPWL